MDDEKSVVVALKKNKKFQDDILKDQEQKPVLVTMTAADVLNSEIPPRDDIVAGLVPRGGLTVLAGAPKSGKTILALQLSLACIRGEEFLSYFETRESRAIYLSGEGGLQLLKERLEIMAGDGDADLEKLRFWWPGERRLSLQKKADRDLIINTCRENETDLLILDPLIRFHDLEENDTKDMALLMKCIAEIRAGGQVAVLAVHHTRKGSGGKSSAEARGSSVLAGEVDSFMNLENRRAAGDHILNFELRWDQEPEPMRLQLGRRTLLFENLGPVTDGRQKMSEKTLYQLMEAAGPSSIEELARIADVSLKTVRGYLNKLCDQGLAGFEYGNKNQKIWVVIPAR